MDPERMEKIKTIVKGMLEEGIDPYVIRKNLALMGLSEGEIEHIMSEVPVPERRHIEEINKHVAEQTLHIESIKEGLERHAEKIEGVKKKVDEVSLLLKDMEDMKREIKDLKALMLAIKDLQEKILETNRDLVSEVKRLRGEIG